jgi:hypothetical protein
MIKYILKKQEKKHFFLNYFFSKFAKENEVGF